MTIGSAMTFTIHCTKKLLDRVKLPVSATPAAPTTYLGNWYATALFWKPQVALLVNERTLLPVLMPLAPAAELAQRFPEYLASVLFAHVAPHALVDHMGLACFHRFFGDCPFRVIKIDFVPCGIHKFALANHRQHDKPQGKAQRGGSRCGVERRQESANFWGLQCAITGFECGNVTWTNFFGRVVDGQ